ncbi:MAG: NADH-quinone oxidoreductase subunit J [Myxococcales bacterium]|nr:NADH-quinone oxidoreductase subunit J [Myxococcota bacterium]MDW8282872.1 NADH-quinone oxidoreductase subunit J [Myxococcales bacterium]
MTSLLPLLSTAQVTPGEVEAPLGPQVAFWVLAALTVVGAMLAVTRRNLIGAVMSLVASFFGLAGLYLLLSAHFLAAIQVLVYAGGIMVLFVFVVMVLNQEEAEPWALRHVFGLALGVAAAVYLAVRLGQLLWAAGPGGGELASRLRIREGAPPQGYGTVAAIGDYFFTEFLFPFEAVSILLVIAVVGAVVLARTTVAKATTVYELPPGEVDLRQPQHDARDEVLGVLGHHAQAANRPGGGH